MARAGLMRRSLFILTFSLQQPESGNRANDDLSSILVFDSTID
jgi:hypothetical protein